MALSVDTILHSGVGICDPGPWGVKRERVVLERLDTSQWTCQSRCQGVRLYLMPTVSRGTGDNVLGDAGGAFILQQLC